MGSPVALNPFQIQAEAAIIEAEPRGLVPYDSLVNKLSAAKTALHSAESTAQAVQARKLTKKVEALSSDIAACRAALIKDSQIIYERARSSAEPFVLGGAALRSSSPEAVSIIKNFGILSGSTHQAPHAVKAHSWGDRPIDLLTGAILCDGSWSVFKNDCAMLGVIHAGRTCYVSNLNGTGEASDLVDDLWELGRPKVLGREIAMLYAADYRQVTPDALVAKFGHVFVPTRREILPKVTLDKLIVRMDKVKAIGKILNMLEYYPDPCVTPKKDSPAASPSLEELAGGAVTPFSPFTAYSPSAVRHFAGSSAALMASGGEGGALIAGGGGGREAFAFAHYAAKSLHGDGGAAARADGSSLLDPALFAPVGNVHAGSPLPLPSPAAVEEVRLSAEDAAALGIVKPMPKSPERIVKVSCGGGAAAARALVSARQLSFLQEMEDAAKAMAKPDETP